MHVSRIVPLVLFTATLAVSAHLTPSLSAQDPAPAPPPDVLELSNGDRITGTIKSMADGTVVVASPLVGDVNVKLADIVNMTTGGSIVLETTSGDRFERQVTGVDNGRLVLAGGAPGEPEIGEIQIDALGRINPPAKETPVWTGSVNVGAQLSAGNTDRRAVSASAEASRRTEDDRITAKFNWIYADEKSAPGVNNLIERRTQGSLKYDYFLSEDLYVLGKVAALGDTRADLDLRFDAGGGLGYQWIDEKDLSFLTEAGLSYFAESYRSGAPDQDTVAARLAYGLMWQIAEGWTFLQDVEALPGLDSSDNIYVAKDSRLRVSLTEAMFMQGQWLMNYDNTPAPMQERVDHRFLVSVGWSF